MEAALLGAKQLQDAIDLDDEEEVAECLDTLSTDATDFLTDFLNKSDEA